MCRAAHVSSQYEPYYFIRSFACLKFWGNPKGNKFRNDRLLSFSNVYPPFTDFKTITADRMPVSCAGTGNLNFSSAKVLSVFFGQKLEMTQGHPVFPHIDITSLLISHSKYPITGGSNIFVILKCSAAFKILQWLLCEESYCHKTGQTVALGTVKMLAKELQHVTVMTTYSLQHS